MAKTSAGAARVALDTSCVVALLCAWHERNGAVAAAVGGALDGGATLIVPVHVLIESYAVLTRLPAPHRMAPSDAFRLLDENFRAGVETPALGARDSWGFLGEASRDGIGGGRSYDALIAAAARRARATALYTLNARHFTHLERHGVTVVSPG